MVSLAAHASDTGDEDVGGVKPSALDDKTHGELCLLYRESANSVRFAKAQQWKSLGSTLMIYAALMVIAAFNPRAELFVKFLLVVSFLVGAGSIYALVIFQVGQNTERAKIRAVAQNLSSLARDIRALEPKHEANVLRYILLAFMVISILLGNAVVLFELTKYING